MSAPRYRAAECHPLRRAFKGGRRCRECHQLRSSTQAVDTRPPIITGVTQRVVEWLSAVCTHCFAPPPAWEVGESYARCRICGEDQYLASNRTITLAHALNENHPHKR